MKKELQQKNFINKDHLSKMMIPIEGVGGDEKETSSLTFTYTHTFKIL
jgi:hypothetical protein